MDEMPGSHFDVLYAEDTLLATQMTKSAFEKQMTQANADEVGTVYLPMLMMLCLGYILCCSGNRDTNNLIYKKNQFRNLTGVDPEQIQPLQEQINLQLPTPQSDNLWSKSLESGNVNALIANKQKLIWRSKILARLAGHYQ